MSPLPSLLLLVTSALATPLLFDGRAPFSLTVADLNNSTGPYLTAVKGSTENATHYANLEGHTLRTPALWFEHGIQVEQALSVAIDNTSVFIPGGTPPQPQFGFRRTDFIAQTNGNHTAFDESSEVGTTVYHFSILRDDARPLNYSHEYQIVWIEPNDGTHIFDIQTGSPFTDPTGTLPIPKAEFLRIRDHATNVVWEKPFTSNVWHNFAVQVNWANLTLGAFYSAGDRDLEAVTGVLPNPSAAGDAGQGDFHFGLLKLPLVNPADSSADQGDVVHFGLQEGDREALIYSGIFVEKIIGGVSVGSGKMVREIY